MCRFGSAGSNRFVDSGRPTRNAQTVQVVRLESLFHFLATRCARLSAGSSFWRLAEIDFRLTRRVGDSLCSTFEISAVGPCRCAVLDCFFSAVTILIFLRKNPKNHGDGRRGDLGTAHFFCRLLPSAFFGLKPGRRPPYRPKPLPHSVFCHGRSPPLAWDFRGLAVLQCEADVSLRLAVPPVPPVLAYFSVRLCPADRAAPRARTRGLQRGTVAVAVVPVQ